MSDSIILDTPEQIAAFRMLAVRRGLRLEIKTGMKVRRGVNLVALANEYSGFTGRNKVKAYQALDAAMAKIPGMESAPL